MKTQKWIRVSRLSTRTWAAIVVATGLAASCGVAGATTLISQDFSASSQLPVGSIVSLQQNTSDRVDTTSVTSANNIFGVVIASDNSQVTLASDQSNQVEVATSGIEQVLVSDMNGNIHQGDAITASPIKGVGMKATNNVKVVGISQDVFPNTTSSKQSYTDKNGQKHTVTLGQVPALINVSYYYKQPDKTLIPSAVQNIANALAGKTVSSLPILVSIGIFIVTLIVVVSIIYAMIHSSIISVGRNPMSQAAVYRNVVQLSSLVVVIMGVATVAIYLVLTKL